MKRVIFTLLIALFAWSACFSRQARIRVSDAGWYVITADEMRQWGISEPKDLMFYSDGLVKWEQTSKGWRHTRNTCAQYRYYIINDHGELTEEADTENSEYAFALHESETRSLCNTGTDFVGEEFTNATKKQTFWLQTPYASSGTAYINVRLAHTGSAKTNASISVDGVKLGTVTLPAVGNAACATSVTGSWEISMTGSSRMSVEIDYTVGSSNGYLDWIEVIYPKQPNQHATPKNVEFIGEVTNTAELTTADLVIVAAPQFVDQAERLGDLHQYYDGISYAVYTEEQIFNSYSGSTPTVEAYRAFLRDMSALGTHYLILFGDGSFDNRGLLSATQNKHNNTLITYQSAESFNDDSYTTDDIFGVLTEGKADENVDSLSLAIGRIPAYTLEQATAYVDKVADYIQNSDLGEWKNRAIFLGDDGDGNEHVRGADSIANTTQRYSPELLVRKLFFDSYKQETTTAGESYPVLKKEFDDYMHDGVLMVNYAGHGGYANLSNEQILSYTDLQSMKNDRLPLWVAETCSFARYDDSKDCGAEQLALNPEGGAIAVISSTRVSYSSWNLQIGVRMAQHMLADGVTVGEALRRAKNDQRTGYDRINRLLYVLLGDPMLRLNYAERHDVVCTADRDTAGALDVVRLEGRVGTDESFNGYVHITVFDKEERLRTLCNDPESKPFEYNYRINPIFKGKTEVRNGEFSAEFVVPKDIRYNYGTARVVMYAWDEESGEEANGAYEGLVIGGECSREVNDTTGPELSMWLNTPTFTDGSTVGRDVKFSAQIFDEYGINTVGSGIGHDLMLWLDDNAEGTVLNNYYTSDLGSYKSGRVDYWLRGLEPGTHRLRFRCWDMVNNSASGQLIFVVDTTHTLSINEVKVTPNPATERAEIVIFGDNPDANLDIVVNVCDISGRIVWNFTENDIKSDDNGNIVIVWDLGGAADDGIYFAEVLLRYHSGKYAKKTAKILVHKQ